MKRFTTLAVVLAQLPILVYGAANPKAGACHTLYQIPTDPRLNPEQRSALFGVYRSFVGDGCAISNR